jgi:RHS repeat-associated protein
MFYGSTNPDKNQRPNRKYYSADGTMEIKHNIVTGAIEFITYLGGDGYTAPVVYKQNHDATTPPSGVGGILYLHRDYQGSILAITDANAAVVEKRLFDAWGSLINYYNVAGIPFGGWGAFDRGYTGHEHLQSIGLIHMNGRLYDPKLHRFLQPDKFVQEPFNTQNYNRYGYCWNNPLKFTDPSGEWFGIDDAIAGVIGGLVNLGVNIWQGNIHNIGQGFAAFGAGAAAGVLSLYGPAGWAAGGAIVGGTNAWLSGKDPVQGALMGGVTGLVGGQLGQWASGAIGNVVVNGIKVTSPR